MVPAIAAVDDDGDVARDRRRNEGDRLLRERAELDDAERHLAPTREREHLRAELARTKRRGLDLLGDAGREIRSPARLAEERRPREHAGEKVVEVVRETAREDAEALELVRLREPPLDLEPLLFGALPVRHVAREAEDAHDLALGIELRDDARHVAANRAVGRDEVEFLPPLDAGGEHLAVDLAPRLDERLGHPELVVVLPEERLARRAGRGLDRPIDVDVTQAAVEARDDVGGVLDDRLEVREPRPQVLHLGDEVRTLLFVRLLPLTLARSFARPSAKLGPARSAYAPSARIHLSGC